MKYVTALLIILFTATCLAADLNIDVNSLAADWALAFTELGASKEVTVKAWSHSPEPPHEHAVLEFKKVTRIKAKGSLLLITHEPTALAGRVISVIRADAIVDISAR